MRALWDEFHELGTEMIVTKVQTKNDFTDRILPILEIGCKKIDIAGFKTPLNIFLAKWPIALFCYCSFRQYYYVTFNQQVELNSQRTP